jgi:hypothetical protein
MENKCKCCNELKITFSFLINNRLYCHYGSDFDGNIYFSETIPQGCICDECISNLIEFNQLKFLQKYI